MQFAINYSPQAVALLDAGKIEVDYFKCPDWDDLIATARTVKPIYVHFPLAIGRGKLGQVDWAKVDRLLAETGTPLVNVHLSPHYEDYPADVSAAQVIDCLYAELGEVVTRYGRNRVIAENNPFYGANYRDFYPLIPAAVDPHMIRRLLTELNCGFLFDISHARISAESIGMDWRDYIRALPLDRIRELHCAGMIRHETGRLEDHLGFTDPDWLAFDWFMGEIRAGRAAAPWIVSFEYGGIGELFEWRSESSVIARDVPRLYAAVHE